MATLAVAAAIAAFVFIVVGVAQFFGFIAALGTWTYAVSLVIGIIAAFAAGLFAHEDW